MDKVIEILKSVLKSFDWKAIVYSAYVNNIKPELQKLVLSTESSWDDTALNAVSLLIEKFFKPTV